jgi:hypothetical protein
MQGVVVAESSEATEHRVRRRSFHQVLEDRQPEFRYGELLILLFVTFFFVGSAPASAAWVPFVTVVIESITLLVALLASGAQGWTVSVSVVIVGVGVISSAVAWISGDPHATKAAAVLTTLLVLVGPVVVVRGLSSRRTIDLRTVLGALSIYMMAGLFFMSAFSAIQSWSHRPFFAQTHSAGPPDFLYYSFVTLTTVGYGDLTAAGQMGRTLAAFEAIFGQFYLVTVVAVLVSNMRPSLRYRQRDADGEGPGDEAAFAE